MYRPHSAQMASNSGMLRTYAAWALALTEIRGFKDPKAPARRVAVSGTIATPTAAIKKMNASTANTITSGVLNQYIDNPVINDPVANPASGAMLLNSTPAFLWLTGAASTTAADKAPLAIPVASP